MADNSAALHDAITNVSTFSQALSRNSDRVDGIMSGLERLTGGGSKAHGIVFSLNAPTDLQRCDKTPETILFMPEPGGLMGLNSDKIPVIGSETPPDFAKGQFTDNIPSLMQAKAIETLENTHCFKSVSRVIDGVEPDAQVILDIRNFNVVLNPEPAAEVDVSAKFAASGQLVGSQAFNERVALASTDAAGAAAALNTAFGKIMTSLASWAVRMAAASPARAGLDGGAPTDTSGGATP